MIVTKLVSKIYDKQVLHEYMHSFLKGDEQLEAFLGYIMDRAHFKKNYFAGIKQLTMHKFNMSNDYEVEEEINSFISSLEDIDSLE